MRHALIIASAGAICAGANAQDLVTIRNATVDHRSTFDGEIYSSPPYRREAVFEHVHERSGERVGDGDLNLGIWLEIPRDGSTTSFVGNIESSGRFSGRSNMPISTTGRTRTTFSVLSEARISAYSTAGVARYVSSDTLATWDSSATIEVEVSGFITADLNALAAPGGREVFVNEQLRSISVQHRRGSSLKAVAGLTAEFAMGAPVGTTFFGFADGLVLPPGTYVIDVAASAIGVPLRDRVAGFNHRLSLGAQFDNVSPLDGPPRCDGGAGWCADVDLDGVFTIEDLFAWLANPIDTDGDGVIEPEPFGEDAGFLAGMLMSTEPGVQDCNENGFPDAYDIAIPVSEGGSEDLDGDGVPDECDALCPADLDGDGELTLFDFLEFQNLFDTGDPIADFDGDGELTLFDFLAFQNAFDAGCP